MAAESDDSSAATTATTTTSLTANATTSLKENTTTLMLVDEMYEFSAPKFYDFVKGESDEDSRNAELWFDVTAAYAPSRMSLFLLVDDSFYFFSSSFFFLQLRNWGTDYF
jgi:targeting protein for Xklp2